MLTSFLIRQLRAQLHGRWLYWLKRRLPAAQRVTLEQKRLFIFPTGAGFLFICTLLLMLLTAINYQNNLIYGLTFWLAMLFIVAIHFTHANLMKLSISALGAEPVFPRQQAAFGLQLDAAGRKAGHYSVQLGYSQTQRVVDVPANTSERMALNVSVGERGWFQPPRLKIVSTYPLGLLRCWSFAYFNVRILVYPTPLPPPFSVLLVDENGTAGASNENGLDDLAGFRAYREGDAMRHIDWRSWARDQQLQTRLFATPSQQDHWLDFSAFDSGTPEQRLSWLCWLALNFDKAGDQYGLRLPGREIAMGSGDRHREQVLRALALFGIEEATH